jgi:hypothetical protein
VSDLLSATGCSVARDLPGQMSFRGTCGHTQERKDSPVQPATKGLCGQIIWLSIQRPITTPMKKVVSQVVRPVILKPAPDQTCPLHNMDIFLLKVIFPHTVICHHKVIYPLFRVTPTLNLLVFDRVNLSDQSGRFREEKSGLVTIKIRNKDVSASVLQCVLYIQLFITREKHSETICIIIIMYFGENHNLKRSNAVKLRHN